MTERLGATHLGAGRCRFVVWSPRARRVEVVLPGRRQELGPAGEGYFDSVMEGVEPGATYGFALDGGSELPDPASRHQPHGVPGPSAVVDLGSLDVDVAGWSGIPLDRYVIYELHVGAFSPEGTFDGCVPYLDGLRDLGVTAVELMPVGQFPGARNWGYDGVYPFAVQDSYGGPQGLARLVRECHRRGLAVVLDVVYNHLGPEGEHVEAFGPYFAARSRTPWGRAMNFDGPGSEGPRRFFIENALQWLLDYRIDALRLDAVDRIEDRSPKHFLEELAEAVRIQADERGRHMHLIAESPFDRRLVLPRGEGGYGLDAQWADDFHHSVHALLTGDRHGYYKDFGTLQDLRRTYRSAFIFGDGYVPGRNRVPGGPGPEVPGRRFVTFIQDHDQVGNPTFGERLGRLVGFEELKLAAGLLLLSPFVPMLFMGEEYGEEAPFHFFVSFSDPALTEAVRRGRISDFASFRWASEPPDPGDEATFLASKLDHGLRDQGHHRLLWTLYRELLRLRRELEALARLSREDLDAEVDEGQGVLMVRRWSERDEALAVFHTGDAAAAVEVPSRAGGWRKRLDSAEERWGGSGSAVEDPAGGRLQGKLEMKPHSFVLFARERAEEVER